jgi:hypothetical protein
MARTKKTHRMFSFQLSDEGGKKGESPANSENEIEDVKPPAGIVTKYKLNVRNQVCQYMEYEQKETDQHYLQVLDRSSLTHSVICSVARKSCTESLM